MDCINAKLWKYKIAHRRFFLDFFIIKSYDIHSKDRDTLRCKNPLVISLDLSPADGGCSYEFIDGRILNFKYDQKYLHLNVLNKYLKLEQSLKILCETDLNKYIYSTNEIIQCISIHDDSASGWCVQNPVIYSEYDIELLIGESVRKHSFFDFKMSKLLYLPEKYVLEVTKIFNDSKIKHSVFDVKKT